MVEIREATENDVDQWRSLRRDGMVRYPHAFMLSLAEHEASNDKDDVSRLKSGGKFLAMHEGKPVGMIGLNPYTLPSMRHRAEIGPLYVVPDFQGTSLARDLMRAAIAYATRAGQWQLELTVNEANTRAVTFYLREGFTQYGRLPNAVIGENGPENDLMLLRILPHPS
ncbi:GNAT family N-acetyltransferase [uncultured Sulfitobacter sp.]|uniref:GNAT family N-acetyltransferase n=1 Tax=uncultured Sulfitobacter sp. TaxID=191468 RepID=UPI00260C5F8F|nr:GNAT family N-acetyltransferase [uncultured Sulfitobacter sp.]